jgi:uncharacterized short protein YbdD (DUF466 family)
MRAEPAVRAMLRRDARSGIRLLRRLWRGLREWCGDAAYERYLRSAARKSEPPNRALTAEQFYVEQLERRYSRPNRCC